MKNLWFAIVMLLLLAGCASTPTTKDQPQPAIPAGCEQSIVYTKISGFMPNGPMLTRVAVATALSMATTTGHIEVKLLVATVMPILYRATLRNDLAPALAEAQARFRAPKVREYVTPLIILADSLLQAYDIKLGMRLTDCDKNVLASLFKNIGLDSGTDPVLFQ